MPGRRRLALFSAEPDAVPAETGGFDAVARLEPPPALRAAGAGNLALETRIDLADAAEAAGCTHLLALRPGERLTEDALVLVAPALDLFQAIFGAVVLQGPDVAASLWRPSRLAVETPALLPHALLHWWVGDRPLVRVEAERRAATALLADQRRDFPAYLRTLWQTAQAIKLATPLLAAAAEPPGLSAADRMALLDDLARDPVFLEVPYGATHYRLPYTGLNAGIEREQTRGLFFEAAELDHLRRRLGRGARIADIGANTGNHTVFFAGPMQAATVIPFEPVPQTAALLERTARENGLSNIDLTRLRVGLSDQPGRARVRYSARGGLGAARLEPDPDGEVEVCQLDALLTEPVDFLKIDVEAMEMQVLASAERVIRHNRPLIFIEIANGNMAAFLGWLQKERYVIERIFSDKGHSNFLIAPASGR